MTNYIQNILGILLLTIFSVPVSASAYFDEIITHSDEFSAGTVAFSVTATTTTGAASGTFTFSIDNTGTHVPQYRFVASAGTCTGSSVSLEASGVDAPFEGEHSVQVAIESLTADCAISVSIDAWQQGLTYGSGGFTASQTLVFNVVVEEESEVVAVMLNEIYPNASSTLAAPLNVEWIELYNPRDVAVDVGGYVWTDLIGTSQEVDSPRTIVSSCPSSGVRSYMAPYGTTSTVIPAHGLLVVYFCASNVLHNEGDTGSLYDASGTLLDVKSFGKTASGKSHARIPDGGTWVDPDPSPGISNMETVTRTDLEAEGWTEEMIDGVLGVETILSTVEVTLPEASTAETLIVASGTEATLPVSAGAREGIIDDAALIDDPDKEVLELDKEVGNDYDSVLDTSGSGDEKDDALESDNDDVDGDDMGGEEDDGGDIQIDTDNPETGGDVDAGGTDGGNAAGGDELGSEGDNLQGNVE